MPDLPRIAVKGTDIREDWGIVEVYELGTLAGNGTKEQTWVSDKEKLKALAGGVGGYAKNDYSTSGWYLEFRIYVDGVLVAQLKMVLGGWAEVYGGCSGGAKARKGSSIKLWVKWYIYKGWCRWGGGVCELLG